MLNLALPQPADRPPRLLLLGAHSDDIEIGCGGTLLHLLAQQPRVDVTWVVFSATPERAQEARRGAALFLGACTGHTDVIVREFRDGFFPHEGAAIKQYFEELKASVAPDIIFTHHLADRHQDHRTIAELTWNTWRDHLVLEYEIPKYDADLGSPNVFVPLGKDLCLRKANYIHEAFRSQRTKPWMSEDTFLALTRLRGLECAAPGLHAEAFHARKMTLSFGA